MIRMSVTTEDWTTQDLKIALQGITLLEGHVLYLVKKITDGVHTSRHKNLGDLAKLVESPNDYAVMIPDNSTYSVDEVMAIIKNPPEEKLIPVGALLAREAEKHYG